MLPLPDNSGFDDAEGLVPTVTPDPAAQIDTLADWLRESFGLSASHAEAVADWHEKIVEDEASRRRAELLVRLIGYLLLPGNVQARAHALAHACGSSALFGIPSQQASADLCGTTRSWISNQVNEVIVLLDLPRGAAVRSDETRAACSRVQSGERHWKRQRKARLLDQVANRAAS